MQTVDELKQAYVAAEEGVERAVSLIHFIEEKVEIQLNNMERYFIAAGSDDAVLLNLAKIGFIIAERAKARVAKVENILGAFLQDAEDTAASLTALGHPTPPLI